MLHLGLEWYYLFFQFVIIPKMLKKKRNYTLWKIIWLYSVSTVIWLCDTVVKHAVEVMGKMKGHILGMSFLFKLSRKESLKT